MDIEVEILVKRAVSDLCDAANAMGGKKDLGRAVCDALTLEHRTMQQSFWSAMLIVIKLYGEIDCDLRNEAAVLWCRKVTELMDDGTLDEYLPTI